MHRLLASVALFAIVLGGARVDGKPRATRPLSKKECDRICVQIVECAGMPHQSSTAVEALICSDDCVFESRDKERRPGWLCAARAQDCDALKACNAGGKNVM
ncbi:MAG TPA: hypothetical protein VKQ32_00765 [Polyangia bacterium]|nr:hypothetical protein [Polyangia bacterium]